MLPKFLPALLAVSALFVADFAEAAVSPAVVFTDHMVRPHCPTSKRTEGRAGSIPRVLVEKFAGRATAKIDLGAGVE